MNNTKKNTKIVLRKYWFSQFGEQCIDKSFTKEAFIKKYGRSKFMEIQKYTCGVKVGKHDEWVLLYKEEI